MNIFSIKSLQQLSNIELLEIEQKFPYFLMPKMIRLKKSFSENTPEFQPLLHKTSIYAFNREALFEYLHGNLHNIAISKTDKNIETASKKTSTLPEIRKPKIETIEIPEQNISAINIADTVEILEQDVEPKIAIVTAVNIKEIEATIYENLKGIIPTNETDNLDNKSPKIQTSNSEAIIDRATENSFLQWLKIIEKSKITSSETPDPLKTEKAPAKIRFELPKMEEKLKMRKDPELDALDGFVRDQIKRKKKKNANIIEIPFEQAIQRSTEKRDIISDGLAQLLTKQGKFDSAIEMYEKLILKYPQKSTFFASQIELVKGLNN